MSAMIDAGHAADIPMHRAQRRPVIYRYDLLDANFLKLIAEIAGHGSEVYDTEVGVPNYTYSRLEGEKSPINHIYEHLRQYITGEGHDHFLSRSHHLAAIAYGASMEYFYLTHAGGPTVGTAVYRDLALPASPVAPSDGDPLPLQQGASNGFAGVPLTSGYMVPETHEPQASAWDRLKQAISSGIQNDANGVVGR